MEQNLRLIAPYNDNKQSIPLHVVKGTFDIPQPFTGTLTEDDNFQDIKGIADKTHFILPFLPLTLVI